MLKHIKRFMQKSKDGEALSPIARYMYFQNFNPVVRFLHSIRYRHFMKFISNLKISEVNLFEIGCGCGGTVAALKKQPKLEKWINYFGIEIDQLSTTYCSEKYPDSVFLCADVLDYAAKKLELPFSPNAVIALECLEHISERDVPRLIDWLSSLNCPVFISVPNEVGPAVVLKNVGSVALGYYGIRRTRAGYTWSETFNAGRYHLDRLPQHETGHKGFDWRWLAAVINQKFVISKIGTSPWNFIPRSLSPSIYFYCQPRAAKN